MKYYYVYYSYEQWGRGYIGCKPSGSDCLPEEDPYLGSFRDKTFNPTHKIILGIFKTPQECLEAEVILHDFFKVDINPHFANLARQTSTGFVSSVKTTEHKERISEALRGKKLSAKTIEKRQKNRKYTEGEEHPFHGKKHSKESREKIKEARALQTNVSGGCSYPWWVDSKGNRTRSKTCPGEGWRKGMKWRG